VLAETGDAGLHGGQIDRLLLRGFLLELFEARAQGFEFCRVVRRRRLPELLRRAAIPGMPFMPGIAPLQKLASFFWYSRCISCIAAGSNTFHGWVHRARHRARHRAVIWLASCSCCERMNATDCSNSPVIISDAFDWCRRIMSIIRSAESIAPVVWPSWSMMICSRTCRVTSSPVSVSSTRMLAPLRTISATSGRRT
jgi:hypothetical protein